MGEHTDRFDDFCRELAPCEVCGGDGADGTDDAFTCRDCDGAGISFELNREAARRVFDRLIAEEADPVEVAALGCTCYPSQNTGGGHRGDCPAYSAYVGCDWQVGDQEGE